MIRHTGTGVFLFFVIDFGEPSKVEAEFEGALVLPRVTLNNTGKFDTSLSSELQEGKLFSGKLDLTEAQKREVKVKGGRVPVTVKFKAYYDGGTVKESTVSIEILDEQSYWVNLKRSE